MNLSNFASRLHEISSSILRARFGARFLREKMGRFLLPILGSFWTSKSGAFRKGFFDLCARHAALGFFDILKVIFGGAARLLAGAVTCSLILRLKLWLNLGAALGAVPLLAGKARHCWLGVILARG